MEYPQTPFGSPSTSSFFYKGHRSIDDDKINMRTFTKLVATIREELMEEIKLKPVIITGSSHPKLADDIAIASGLKICSTIDYFACGECRPKIEETVRGRHVFVIQTGTPNNGRSTNDYIIETILLLQACKLADAAKITLICPCLPYARQDKKDNSRAAISSKAIIDCFAANGMSRLVCLDLHSASIQGFFSGPVDNLYATPLIVDYFERNIFIETDKNKFIIAAPDHGAIKRTAYLANKLSLPKIQMEKSRDYSKKNTVDEIIITGDVNLLVGKIVIIPDDMCDTGSTVIKAAEKLVDEGAVGVIVVVTHGILSDPATERLNNCPHIMQFICSDSIPLDDKKQKSNKIKTFSIAPLMAQVIDCIVNDKSISDLFDPKAV
jgi:ribose-phosphate pyrophosphokinase